MVENTPVPSFGVSSPLACIVAVISLTVPMFLFFIILFPILVTSSDINRLLRSAACCSSPVTNHCRILLFNYLLSSFGVWSISKCRICLTAAGYFFSTQDTLLALEALTEFSYRQTNRAFYNLQLEFESTSNSSWTQTVKLDKSNFANLYTFSVRNL